MKAAKGMIVDSESGKRVAVDPETAKIIKAMKGAFIDTGTGENRTEN